MLAALLMQAGQRFPNDTGPVYKETVAGRIPVEPFNTLSNLVFLFIVVYFSIKVYREPKKHPFLVWALPVIGLGYIGGTIYHATRSAEIWLLLDWVPITALSLAGVVYFIFKWMTTWPKRILLILIMAGLFFGLSALPLPPKTQLTLNYIITAATIAIPIIGYLQKTRWHNLRYVAAAFGIFSIAVFFRFLDQRLDLDFLWMGTHWLWHTFGGLAVFFLIKYIYRDNSRETGGIS